MNEGRSDLDPTPITEPDRPVEARQVGPYRLLQKIGEGGMGTVWLAEQAEPVRRRVALKVIRQGMDTEQVVARFEAERQALAVMDHPCIAKVLDAGTTPEGRPYFVMEHVPGVAITEHCDRHKLSILERLELFCRVCEGVQHAHHKAIIHRDLKPSNVLVSVQEGTAVPKIIDFGVAKATAQRLTEKTMYTARGVLIGTPEYMSPEQAEMTGQDVDTRTDVYSLGVILYELLVGTLPIDPKALREASFDGLRQMIREHEPLRPSSRVSALGKAAGQSAERRRVEVPVLRRELAGDLDWIVMTALDKDRTRRYGSPSDLASDIRRYLANEVVKARPPSTGYRVRKFARRHRTGVAIAASLLIALVGFSVTVTALLGRTSRERDRANREARAASEVSEFLIELFADTNPSRSGSHAASITARELLDRGVERIGDRLHGTPEIRARIVSVLGRVHGAIALHDRAGELLEEALAIQLERRGEQHPETADTLYALGEHYATLHDARSLEAHERSLAAREASLGPDHPAVADSLCRIAWYVRNTDPRRARGLIERALKIRETHFGEESREMANALNILAALQNNAGDWAAARRQWERTVAISERVLGPDHPSLASYLNNLSFIYRNLGEFDRATSAAERALAIRERAWGPDHPEVALALSTVAHCRRDTGDYVQSRAESERALRIMETTFGPDSIRVTYYLRSVGQALGLCGEYEAGRSRLEQALAIRIAQSDRNSLRTAVYMRALGFLLVEMGQLAAAGPLLEDALSIAERSLGEQEPDELAGFYRALAHLRREQGSLEEARAFYERDLELLGKVVEADHFWNAEPLSGLADVLAKQGELTRSRELFERARAMREAVYGPRHPAVATILHDYADMLRRAGDHESSRRLWERTLEIRRERLGARHPKVAESLDGLARLLREMNVTAGAERTDRS